MFAEEIIREMLENENLDSDMSNQVVIDILVDYVNENECDYSVGMLFQVFTRMT